MPLRHLSPHRLRDTESGQSYAHSRAALMSATKNSQFEIEPERYELTAGPAYHFETDRRDFFKFLGAGLLVVMALKTTHAQESGSRSHASEENLPKDIAAWLHIGENGKVTVYT